MKCSKCQQIFSRKSILLNDNDTALHNYDGFFTIIKTAMRVFRNLSLFEHP